jgi:uncharacterized damage-inducible protein DinB
MDIEKTMEFILEQQGEFAAHIGALREQQANSARQIDALSQTVQGLVEVARLQSERLDAHDRRLEAQDKRLEAQEKRSEAFQKRFDQFLERFDTYLRGRGRNGG